MLNLTALLPGAEEVVLLLAGRLGLGFILYLAQGWAIAGTRACSHYDDLIIYFQRLKVLLCSSALFNIHWLIHDVLLSTRGSLFGKFAILDIVSGQIIPLHID